MRASGSKPPGMSTFNVEPVIDEPESGDQVEVLDSLPLGALALGDLEPDQFNPSNKWMELTAPVILGPLDEWRESYPRWKEQGVWARRRVGDCYALVADSILTLSQPFPGDERFVHTDLRPELRFRVIRDPVAPEYVIQDYLVNGSVAIAKSLLEKTHFNLGRWYAKQRGSPQIYDKAEWGHAKMGDALAVVSTKLLEDGIRSYYPSRRHSTNPAFRFRMLPPSRLRKEYLVLDRDLGYQTKIEVEVLEEPTFDLIGWYMQELARQAKFDWLDECVDSYDEDEDDSSSDDSHHCSHDHELAECSKNVESSKESTNAETTQATGGSTDEIYDDLPALLAWSDDSASDDGEWAFEGLPYNTERANLSNDRLFSSDEAIGMWLKEILTEYQPFPGDGYPIDPTLRKGDPRFVVNPTKHDLLRIYDRVQGFDSHLHIPLILSKEFSVGKWYAEQCAFNSDIPRPWKVAHEWAEARKDKGLALDDPEQTDDGSIDESLIEIGGVQVDRYKYPALQRNSAQVKGNQRILPKPVVIKVIVNGQPARALLDTGSLGDFVSSTLAEARTTGLATVVTAGCARVQIEGEF